MANSSESIFTILAPPKYPKLNAMGNSFLSVSLVFGLVTLMWFLPETASEIIETHHWPLVSVITCLIAIILALISGGAIIYRRLHPAEIRKEQLGKIHLHNHGVDIQLNGQEKQWTWAQISRLDVYFSYGLHINSSTKLEEQEAFMHTEVLHLRFKTPKGFSSYHVLNKTADQETSGVLFQRLTQIRKMHINLHRKIQFWRKIKTA